MISLMAIRNYIISRPYLMYVAGVVDTLIVAGILYLIVK